MIPKREKIVKEVPYDDREYDQVKVTDYDITTPAGQATLTLFPGETYTESKEVIVVKRKTGEEVTFYKDHVYWTAKRIRLQQVLKPEYIPSTK